MRYSQLLVVISASLFVGCQHPASPPANTEVMASSAHMTEASQAQVDVPAMATGQAALQVTLSIASENRAAAAGVFQRYRQPFLTQIDGATSKQLLLRSEDVQVLHHFDTVDQARNYLGSDLFNSDVVVALTPLLSGPPEVRVYDQLAVVPVSSAATGAYLQISLDIAPEDRPSAAGVYLEYRQPFLDTVAGALSKDLFIRDDDVQVLHGFATTAQANTYLNTSLFNNDVVVGLQPYLNSAPEVRIYEVFPE